MQEINVIPTSQVFCNTRNFRNTRNNNAPSQICVNENPKPAATRSSPVCKGMASSNNKQTICAFACQRACFTGNSICIGGILLRAGKRLRKCKNTRNGMILTSIAFTGNHTPPTSTSTPASHSQLLSVSQSQCKANVIIAPVIQPAQANNHNR